MIHNCGMQFAFKPMCCESFGILILCGAHFFLGWGSVLNSCIRQYMAQKVLCSIMDLRGFSKQWSCDTFQGGDRWMSGQGQPAYGPPHPEVSCHT